MTLNCLNLRNRVTIFTVIRNGLYIDKWKESQDSSSKDQHNIEMGNFNYCMDDHGINLSDQVLVLFEPS